MSIASRRHVFFGTRSVALSVHGLGAGTDRPGSAAFGGLDLVVEPGSLTLLTPRDRGAAVLLCLAGCLPVTSGTYETPGSRPTGPGPGWRMVVLDSRMRPCVDDSAVSGDCESFDSLPSDADLRVRDLEAALRLSPGVLGLIDPLRGLTEEDAAGLERRIRALCEVQGRTLMIATSDTRAFASGAAAVVAISPPVG